MMTTGMAGLIVLTAASASRPDTFSMRTSISTRS